MGRSVAKTFAPPSTCAKDATQFQLYGVFLARNKWPQVPAKAENIVVSASKNEMLVDAIRGRLSQSDVEQDSVLLGD